MEHQESDQQAQAEEGSAQAMQPQPAEPPPSRPPAAEEAAPPAPARITWRVTGAAKIAAIILLISGVVGVVGGLLLLGGGALLGAAGQQTDLPELAGAFGAVFATLGIVVVILGAIEVLAAIGTWVGNGLARVVGVIYGALGVVFALSGLGSSDTTGLVVSLVFLALYAYVVVVLIFRWKASPQP